MRGPIVALAFASVVLGAKTASAFCGFYVSGADAKLFNNATQVVLMREGLRTVLSMQNNYQGPPENFALVVPVPVVLQKENVKTLPRDLFDRVDKLAAPRLVEYWEQDPCAPQPEYAPMPMAAAAPMGAVRRSAGAADLGVKIEAQFTVGEYEVVILSARDSMGLDTWLRREKYAIPAGAEPILRPYVASGMKFFVAKVDTSKVTFEKGMATLSPLRFHYDTESFTLPIRLGLVNSPGTQDLIVHILAKGQRYQATNYPNVTIPTNFDVDEKARGEFGSFYAALFDRTVEKTPKAVVTEYSWDASSCDPCPLPALTPSELATLGADVLGSSATSSPIAPGAPPPGTGPSTQPRPAKDGGTAGPSLPRPIRPPFWTGGFVLTRLHVRYGKETLGDDLVFAPAPPIQGGREVYLEAEKLEHGAQPSGMNNFQARYAIRHPWTGPIACDHPVRHRWGGPPGGAEPKPMAATNTAFAPRGAAQLASFVRSDVPELGLTAAQGGAPGANDTTPTTGAPSATPSSGTPPKAPSKGCAGCTTAPTSSNRAATAFGIAIAALAFRRRRRAGSIR